MFKKRKYLTGRMLCVVSLMIWLSGAGKSAPVKAYGTTLQVETVSGDHLLEQRYLWQARYREGITRALPVCCDDRWAEEFPDWESEETAGVASLSEGDGVFAKGEEPGCYYFDVGAVRQEDGVHTVDMRLCVTAYYGGKNEYDSSTSGRLAEGSFDGISHSGKEGTGRPCISFLKNAIGLRLYGVERADVSIAYYDHKSGQPLAVSGHGTLGNLKESQTVSFLADSQVAKAFQMENAQDGGKDISYFFQNTDVIRLCCSQKEILTSFVFVPRTVGKFALVPMGKPAHRVGPRDCAWQEATLTSKDAPYVCEGYEEFDILAKYRISMASLQSFCLQEILPEGLAINGERQVSVYDREGEEVTGRFAIEVLDSGEIRCTGGIDASWQATADEGQSYLFRFRVHRRQRETPESEEGDTFLQSSRVTLRVAYETAAGSGEQTTAGNPIWVESRISPALSIRYEASRYEWRVGEKIDYTVEVTQTKRGAQARNLVIAGEEFPAPIRLLGGCTVTGSQEKSRFVIKREGENGWKCTGPLLQYGETVTIRFWCLATRASNGKEWESFVFADTQNLIDPDTGEKSPPVLDRAEIWVNSPVLQVSGWTARQEWTPQETVEYQVTAVNLSDYTVAKKVTLTGTFPEGLQLAKDASPLEITGMPKSVRLPVKDEKTGMARKGEKPVRLQIDVEENTWRLTADYFPSQTALVIKFFCQATEAGKGGAASGRITAAGKNLWAGREEAGYLRTDRAILALEEEIHNPCRVTIEDGRLAEEFRVGEEVEYQVRVKNCRPDTIVRNLHVENLHLPRYLQLQDGGRISVEGMSKTASEKPEISKEADGWRLDIRALPYDTPVTITWRCTVGGEANGKEIISRTKAWGENAGEVWAEGKLWVNTPRLVLQVQTGQAQCQPGDVLAYRAKATQAVTGCVARSVLLESSMEAAEAKFLRHFVTVWDTAGEEMAPNRWISEKALAISTSQSLVREDGYLVWEPEKAREIQQKLWNPLGITGEKSIRMEYCAEITKKALIRKEAVNLLKVNSQEQHPVEIRKRTEILAPELIVEGESIQAVDSAKETVCTHIRVGQAFKKQKACQIAIEAAWNLPEAQAQRDTLRVTKNQEILSDIKVVWKERGFRIETKEELAAGDCIDVYYQTPYDTPPFAGTVCKTIVRASGDNTKEAQADICTYIGK